jgi:hypothetical protein
VDERDDSDGDSLRFLFDILQDMRFEYMVNEYIVDKTR